MQPSTKRFNKKFLPIADGISSQDIAQDDRVKIANSVADELESTGDRDFRRDLFVMLASDPLVPCAGHHDEPCEHGRVIRHRMRPEEGQFAPYGKIRCVSCGAHQFIPEYHANVTAGR